MIDFRCPTCNAKASAPQNKAGSTGKCRNCGSRIAVPVPEQEPVVTFRAVEDIDSYDNRSEPEPFDSSDEFPTGPAPERPMPRAAGTVRYPNLVRYLDWVRTSVLVVLILALIFAALFALGGAYAAVTEDLISGLAGVLMGLVTAVVGYMVYTFYNALIEFVRVVMDIEANTREVNNSLRALGEQA